MLATAMLGMSVVFGGNALTAPLAELVAQVGIALAAIAWLWLCRGPGGEVRGPVARAWVIAGLVLALPLLQLVPLPPAIWHALPGRATEIEALALIGAEQGWRPLSVTPSRTLAALLTAGCGVAMLLATAALDRRGRDRLLLALVAAGGLTLLAGAAQVSGGDGNPFRFYLPHQSYLTGFQSSHNLTADVLLIAMAALGAVVANSMIGRERAARQTRSSAPAPTGLAAILVAGDLLLALGVVLTASRTGIAMLPVPLLAQAVMFRRRLRFGRRGLAIGVAGLALGGLLAVVLGHNAVIGRVMERFTLAGELRPQIWHDAMLALRATWPWGTGLGSFGPVYAPFERLEMVRIFHTATADLDYLQFAVEAGLPGLVVLAAVVALLAGAGWRRLREGSARAANQAICAFSILSTIGIHSLLEFPLRTIALAAMAGVGGGLLHPVAGSTFPSGTVKEHS